MNEWHRVIPQNPTADTTSRSRNEPRLGHVKKKPGKNALVKNVPVAKDVNSRAIGANSSTIIY